MSSYEWPKGPYSWQEGDTAYVSVPFTWNLPEVERMVECDLFAARWIVGGPALTLMPDFFQDYPHVEVRQEMPGILQRVNPGATRTSLGCPNNCAFCSVDKIEGEFRELEDWPDLPIICDSNLLATSLAHFDRVLDRLVRLGTADFNQGLDCQLLTDYHARRIAEITKPMVRLALDSDAEKKNFGRAVELLLAAGIPKRAIRAYCLVGFRHGPEDDWRRCEFVESFGLKALPMWYHPPAVLKHNSVTPRQSHALGWTRKLQRQIMQWYYQHRGSRLID